MILQGRPLPPTTDRSGATFCEGYGGTVGNLKGGDLFPDGTPTGLGRMRPATRVAQHDYGQQRPYGTSADVHVRGWFNWE